MLNVAHSDIIAEPATSYIDDRTCGLYGVFFLHNAASANVSGTFSAQIVTSYKRMQAHINPFCAERRRAAL